MFRYSLIVFFISFFAIAQVPQKTVIAVSGDGIYTLLRKNNLDPIKYYKVFIELNEKNLDSTRTLSIGKTYILPNIKTVLKDSISPIKLNTKIIVTNTTKKLKDSLPKTNKEEHLIFGDTYKFVPNESHTLKGAVYYLISGHGGPDPGATTTYNGILISEDEYAYDVTLRLARKLIANGARVYLIIKDDNDGIRDKRILKVDYDEVNYPNSKIPRSQKERLRLRTKAVNNLYIKNKGNYQRLIVTHVDSRSESKNIDVFFYHHKNSKNGKRLAQYIHNSFKQKYAEHQPNRKYSGTIGSRNLYLIKNTLPPMVYIELGNIKNSKDQKRILNYQNREALANWIYNGILKDYTSKH